VTELVVLSDDEQTGLVILEQPKPVFSAQELLLAVQVVDERTVIVEPERAMPIVTAGTQGVAGVPGAPGSSVVPSAFYPAGQVLGGHRVVRISNGKAFYADNTTASANAVFGITLGAANLDEPVEIRYAGIIVEPSWNWTPELPIFLGAAGAITQIPPVVGALVELGVALTPTSVNVRIQEPVFLS
jgi:hypothetical protein